MVVAEHAQGTRIQQEVLPRDGGQSEPARREYAQHMSMREQGDVTRYRTRTGDHPIRPGTYLHRRLAARAAVPKNQPARRLLTVPGRQSLVFAVVPLDEVGINYSHVAEARQFAGVPCPLQRADENERECLPGQYRLHQPCKSTAVVGQWDVCRARVLAAQAP